MDEIIPIDHGMELTVEAGEIFYIDVNSRDFEKLGITEKDDIWISFRPDEIAIISGHTD